MTDYLFLEENPESGFTDDFDRGLFHEPAHLALQSKTGWLTFSIVDTTHRILLAFFPIHLESFIARSPYKSPYGSLIFSEKLPPKVIFDFLLFVEEKLVAWGVKEIQIKNPPLTYNPGQLNLLQVLLLNRGFSVTNAEVGAIINVDHELFQEKIFQNQQQKLKQAKAGSLTAEQISISRFREVFDFIERCYNQKEYKLSMTADQLQSVVDHFPDRFVLSVVKQGQILVAAAISIHVTKKVLYNFYIAHDPLFNTLSPAVVLLESIYTYCQHHHVATLDLGTSSLDGTPNFPLLDFKRRQGAVFTSKLSFVKKF